MSRELAAGLHMCSEHPHRPASDRCDRCFRHFCPECFVRAGPQLLCQPCAATARARGGSSVLPPAETRSGWHAVAEALRHVAVAAVLLGMLLLTAGAVVAGTHLLGASSAARKVGSLRTHANASTSSAEVADLPGVTERLAVERYCTGGQETLTALPEPGGSGTSGATLTDKGAYAADVVAALTETDGASQASHVERSASSDLFDPMNLVRSHGSGDPGWRSQSAVLPQQVGFALRQAVVIDRVAFWQTSASPPAAWVRDVTLLASATMPNADFRMAGRWTLSATTDVQTFSFVAIRARYLRLCFQSRHGNADFVSLGGVMFGVLTGTVVPDSRPLGPLPPGYSGSVQ